MTRCGWEREDKRGLTPATVLIGQTVTAKPSRPSVASRGALAPRKLRNNTRPAGGREAK